MLKRTLAVFCILAMTLSAKADEGMWLPIWLKAKEIEKMQQMGLSVPIDKIYDHNAPSLKDAVVSLDNGSCTAEFVSANGLLLTNHHCGFDDIQAHSTLDNDYIQNGFWAQSPTDELPNPGKTATLLVRAIEISHLYEPLLKLAESEQARSHAIDSLTEIFEADAKDSSHLDAHIASFFNDSRFVLFLTKTYRDVRLVGTPPQHIGNFGGETDNWMWPRHTGDFCIFRVYCAPNGEPADYSPQNVPFKPKKFLPISVNGYNANDFTMVMGYPGNTNRYATASEIRSLRYSQNTLVNEVRTIKQNILKARMAQSPQIAIQYAAKYDQSANYQKYALGQNQGIDRLGLIDRQTQKERQLVGMLQQMGDTLPVSLLSNCDSLSRQFDKTIYTSKLVEEVLMTGPELPYFALQYLNDLVELKETPPSDSTFSVKKDKLNKLIDDHFKDFDIALDQKVFTALVDYASAKEKEKSLPFNFVPKKHDNAQQYAEELYTKSLFLQRAPLEEMIAGKLIKKLRKDPLMLMLQSVFGQYENLSMLVDAIREAQNKTARHLLEATGKMYPDSSFSPDANSTMRLSFGSVKPYEPRDGVWYDYFTTTNGILAKIDPTVKEFKMPETTRSALAQGDFGRYAQNGLLHTCFITTNDITGGNSGSPVINGNGQLIGLAFDGNWEAMTSDLAYSAQYQRTICVDIRYVLWTIEKIGKAQHLISEMEIH